MNKNICIFDPSGHIPGLKILFENAKYFSIDPNDNPELKYQSTNHFNINEFEEKYNFKYETDLNFNEDLTILFLVLPLLDCISGSKWSKDYGIKIVEKIKQEIIKKHSWKKIILFDTYDYDYDPNNYNLGFKIDFYFKRNFNKFKKYNKNVIPFPYQMFVYPCVLTSICNYQENNQDYKYNKIFWCGNLYDHIDNDFNVYRYRYKIYEKIKNYVETFNWIEPKIFLETLKEYKIGLDLIGVGDPNKRTFEILLSDRLLLTNIKELDWGFEENDYFEPETIFIDENDFIEKINLLLNDESVYKRCINKQKEIVKKYMNKEYLKQYITKYI